MPLFEFFENTLKPIQPLHAGPDLYEKEIERLLWENLEALTGEPLFPLARQPKIEGGGIPDIVALDESGRVVVIEVKRDVDRSQLAQCLEYAGWARSTSLDELSALYPAGVSKFFEDWQDFTKSGTPMVVNPAARLFLVAGDIHGRTRSAVDFLVENGLPVVLIVVNLYADAANHKFIDVKFPQPSHVGEKASADGPSSAGVGQLYYQFWGRYLERLHVEHPSWSNAKAPQTSNWINQPSPVKGTVISLSFAAGHRLRHELYIDSGDDQLNLTLLKQLESQKAVFESAYGRSLNFEELPGKRACRVGDYREDSSVSDSDQYDQFIDWFFDAGARLRKALGEVNVESSIADSQSSL
jgi:hypothetical protein